MALSRYAICLINLGLLVGGFPAIADDFKTLDGKEYKNVTVKRVELDGIVLNTSAGIWKLYFTELPNEIRNKYRYDPIKASEYAKKVAEAQAEAQEAEKKARRQASEENKRAADELNHADNVRGASTGLETTATPRPRRPRRWERHPDLPLLQPGAEAKLTTELEQQGFDKQTAQRIASIREQIDELRAGIQNSRATLARGAGGARPALEEAIERTEKQIQQLQNELQQLGYRGD